VENSEIASPDAAPDAGLAGADVPVSVPDAVSPDAPLVTPDAPGLRADTSAGAETASETSGPLTCVDKDGDGYGMGAGCRGPDCDDTNTNVWSSCGTCQDADGDGYFVGCDRYTRPIMGPDCDDAAPFCTNSCVDADKNGTADCAEYWFGEANVGTLGASSFYKASDGNFLIPTRTNAGFGSTDIQLIKITSQGRVLWKKIYGTAQDEELTGAVQATDGSLLLLASIQSGSQNIGPLIVKVSEDGVVLASKTVTAAIPGEWMNYAASLLSNGDFLVTGSVDTGYDSWVGQLSADVLSFQWQTKYTGLKQGAMDTLLSFPDGDIFVVRHEWGSPSSQLLKLGPKGELRWARGGLPWYAKAALEPNGNVVLTWIGQSAPFTVLTLTPGGDVLWQRSTLEHGAADISGSSLAIQTDSLGNVIAAASNNLGGTATTPVSWLTKLSTDGDVLWTHSTGKYAPSMLSLDSDGGILLVDAKGMGRVGADPSTSCFLGPQTDTLKPSNVTFAGIVPAVSTMTPWVLADYPISTMSGTVTWKPICPAAAP